MGELREKVRAILWEENPNGEERAWDRLVSRPEREVNEMEYVSRFWGYAFGVAYGIARSEEPSESDADAASRAFEVALALFEDDGLHGLDFIRALEAGKAADDMISGRVAA